VIPARSFQSAVDEFKSVIDGLGRLVLRATSSASAYLGFGGGSTAGSGGHGGAATMGSAPSAQAQLGAAARLRQSTQAQQTLSQGSSNTHQFMHGLLGPNVVNRPAAPGPGVGPLSRGRWAQIGGQVVRAGAQVAGSVASGYMSSQQDYSTALDLYTRQNALWNPAGGLSGGQLAASYGRAVQQYGGQYWGNGPGDMFGAGLTINQQAYQQNYGRMMTAASTMAMLNPGMGLQEAARMQGVFGSAQAFYGAQMFGLTTPRSAGGGQVDPMATMNSLANRVNANIGGFQNLSQDAFKAEMVQGGSLASSVAAFGSQIGLSGQQQQAIGNIYAAENKLTSPADKSLARMSLAQAQNLLDAASSNPESSQGQDALKTLNKYGFGDTLSAAKNMMQGRQANGYLSDSADYLDAAKASANTLSDIYSLLQKTLSPVAGVAGAYQQGGVVGATGYAGGKLMDATGSRGSYNAGKGFGNWIKGKLSGSYHAGENAGNWIKKKLNSIGGGSSGSVAPSQTSKASSAGSSAAPGGTSSAALAFAKAQLGKPYVYGANGPDSWDCSSLTQAAWRAGGIDLPRTSQEQSKVGAEVPLSDTAPGDLIFYGSPGDATHVGLVVGPDEYINAPHTGDVVKYGRISQNSAWKFARRVAAGGNAVSSNLGGGLPGAAKTRQGGGTAPAVGGASTSLGGAHAEIEALASALTSGGGGAWGGSAADMAPSQNDSAKNSASNPAGADAGGYDWGEIKGKVTTVPAPPKEVRDAISAAMAVTGVSGADWARGLTTIAFRESGYDRTATNNYDSNARAGHPSRGPFQMIDSTFEDNRVASLPDDVFNVEASAAAAINYIRGRYHGIKNVQQSNPDLPTQGYAAGAWDVPTTQTAQLHPGEMVLPQVAATAMRQALMDQKLGVGPSSSSGGVNINFNAGSITVQMPTASAEGARSAAKSFVDFIAADDRIKTLMGGW
jgi:cell wall-associated NlpC family hydrolase